MNLLEKAKCEPTKKRSRSFENREEIDLALAFIRGEVTAPQVGAALDKKCYSHSNIYSVSKCWAFSVVALAVRTGRLRIELQITEPQS